MTVQQLLLAFMIITIMFIMLLTSETKISNYILKRYIKFFIGYVVLFLIVVMIGLDISHKNPHKPHCSKCSAKHCLVK